MTSSPEDAKVMRTSLLDLPNEITFIVFDYLWANDDQFTSICLGLVCGRFYAIHRHHYTVAEQYLKAPLWTRNMNYLTVDEQKRYPFGVISLTPCLISMIKDWSPNYKFDGKTGKYTLVTGMNGKCAFEEATTEFFEQYEQWGDYFEFQETVPLYQLKDHSFDRRHRRFLTGADSSMGITSDTAMIECKHGILDLRYSGRTLLQRCPGTNIFCRNANGGRVLPPLGKRATLLGAFASAPKAVVRLGMLTPNFEAVGAASSSFRAFQSFDVDGRYSVELSKAKFLQRRFTKDRKYGVGSWWNL